MGIRGRNQNRERGVGERKREISLRGLERATQRDFYIVDKCSTEYEQIVEQSNMDVIHCFELFFFFVCKHVHS